MRERRVVITQVGTVNPLGFGKEEFWNHLISGQEAPKQVTRFDLTESQSKTAGLVEIDLDAFLNERGVKRLDRNTKLILSTIKKDLQMEEFRDLGVAIGTIFGSLEIVSNFDRITLLEGPKNVSPSDFSLSVINAATSQANISYNLHALSSTISTGFNAGLDAAGYAYQYIQRGYLNEIICGGSEELSEDFYRGMASQGLLISGSNEKAIPFDVKRNGCVLGEGCGLLTFEELAHATKREKSVLAEVVSYCTVFHPTHRSGQGSGSTGFYRSMKRALAEAGVPLQQIQWILASANGWSDDIDELHAIDQLAREEALNQPIYVSSLKGQLGECGGATGAIQLIAGIFAMQKGVILPTVGLLKPEFLSKATTLNTTIESADITYLLINSKGLYGNYSTMIIKKLN